MARPTAPAPDPCPPLPESAPRLGLRHGLARSAIFVTDLTLAIILFRLSEPKAFSEVVHSGRVGMEHGQHACHHAERDIFTELRRLATPKTHRRAERVHLHYVLKIGDGEIKEHHDEVLCHVVEDVLRSDKSGVPGRITWRIISRHNHWEATRWPRPKC